MKLATNIAGCIIIAVFLSVAESRSRCPVLHASSDSQKSGCYIIVLKEATSAENFNEVLAKVVKVADDAKVYGMVQRVAKAFTVKLTPYALHLVSYIYCCILSFVCSMHANLNFTLCPISICITT